MKPIRRVITCTDAQGISVVSREGFAPSQHEDALCKGRGLTDVWVWRKTPQPLHGLDDTGLWPDEFPGPAGGGHLRVMHRLADMGESAKVPIIGQFHAPRRAADGSRGWNRGGGNGASITDMHKTESVDFGIVLEGERVLVCDEGLTVIRPGDIVVQVGAWHLWDSSRVGCHMAFDMISASFGPGDGSHGLQEECVPMLQSRQGQNLPPGVKPQRRIITIDREPGKSMIVTDTISPDVRTDPARPGFAIQRIWVVAGHPAPIVPETLQLPYVLVPPRQGTVLNVVTFPPDETWKGKVSAEQASAFYASVGASAIATCGSLSDNPYSQKSNTVDFLFVTEGEITLELDNGEATIRAGEIGIVRGGNHAICNRTRIPAVVAIASHDADPEDG